MTKVSGGYLLNGEKRWIGNGTHADYINVWARNPLANNKVQCFVVETANSPGLTRSKMEGKYSLRMTQNADIQFKNVFVPDRNKLTHANDFATGTNRILESSRVLIAWVAAGC